MSFTWVPYYKELAEKLLQYKDRRKELVKIVYGLDDEYVNFLRESETKTEFDDIHPFAIFAIFSRLVIISKKQAILQYFKSKFNLVSAIPEDFDGIPSINPQKSFWGLEWFTDNSEIIDQNWDLFEIASADKLDEEKFINAFDLVIKQNGAKWNVTQALFRAFPEKFLSLDENSRNYLIKHEIQVMKDKDFNGKSYLELSKLVKTKIDSKELKEGNFVTLSYNSWVAGNEAVNYWLIAPGENARLWEEFYSKNIIGIGWDDLGDYSQYKNNKDKFVSEFLKLYGADKKRSSTQVWRFYTEIKENDYVIVKNGLYQIIGIGIIESDYYYDNSRTEYKSLRKVKWLKTGKWNFPGQAPQETVTLLKDDKVKEIMNSINKTENEKTLSLMNLLETNKNLILHGAPGTGKTYTAKDIAAQMICGKSFAEIEAGSEDERVFNEHTEFVQFHPSYDYSDFVEGLRPIEGENSGEVGFERKDGVFKEFCNRALKKNNVGGNDTFEKAWNLFVDELNEKESIQIKTVNNKAQFTVRLNQNGDGLVDEQETYTRFYNYQQLYNVYRGLPGVPNRGHDNYRLAVINYLKEKHQLTDYKKGIESSNDGQKFIFIIDEINRGEMSKIFGELFYSIDPDYRGPKGKVRTQYANMLKETNDFDEALQITNSFGHFFIPENVYIIGTMNDIDRSVDSMDFAMRRRFTFVELKANECIDMLNNLQLSEGITKSDILEKMTVLNNEIEKISGLSSSYHIGGSYFAKLSKYSNKSKNEAFECLWNNHLKPLITDYLRGLPNMDAKLSSFKTKYDEAGNETSEESDN